MSMSVMANGHKPLNSNNRPRDKWVEELRALYSDPIDLLALDDGRFKRTKVTDPRGTARIGEQPLVESEDFGY